jgi:hypothetical protein
MNRHTYLRAYMAGITFPTFFLIVIVAGFCIWRYVYNVSVPIERAIMFPMAAVPNLWGVWNMLFIASHGRTRLSIGFHGALLPLLLGPLGILLTNALSFPHFPFFTKVFPVIAPLGLIFYYLAWKYLVGFLNGVLGIA